MEKYLKHKTKNSSFSWNGITVTISDPIESENFSVKKAFKKVSSLVPSRLLGDVEAVYIGGFDFLKSRDLQALYQDGVIFLTNEYEEEEDMVDDIVHEVAHSIEKKFSNILYSDGSLQREFLLKRREMQRMLDSKGFEHPQEDYLNPEYSLEFDEFLYNEVGYTVLRPLVVNIFYSPYAGTSLSEYYANGFEAVFYDRDMEKLRDISPVLASKIAEILFYTNRDSEDVL